MKKVMGCFLAIMMALAVAASAADSAKVEMSVMPAGAPPEMKLLTAMEGTFQIVTKMRQDPSQPWQEGTGTVSNKLILDGCALEQTYAQLMGQMPYQGLGIICFHRGLGQWQYTWADNMGYGMSYYLGTFADGKLIVSGEDKLPDMTMMNRVTTSNITDKQYEWMIETSMDGGKTWFVMGTAVYTKK